MRCEVCKLDLPADLFNWKNKTNGTKQSHCRECQKRYKKAHYNRNTSRYREKSAARKKEIVDFVNARKNQPCTDCKREYPYYVMQFDHINDDKTFEISFAVRNSMGIETIKKEITKCEVVCANCHAARTHQRKMKQKKPKVVFADTVVTEALEPYIQEVLDCIAKNGCPGAKDAFVSDLSKFWDFESCVSDDEEATLDYDAIEAELGVPVESDDFIVSVATKLSKK